jgi:hypothetical protein
MRLRATPKAKAWCPLSKLMKADIGFSATLVA